MVFWVSVSTVARDRILTQSRRRMSTRHVLLDTRPDCRYGRIVLSQRPDGRLSCILYFSYKCFLARRGYDIHSACSMIHLYRSFRLVTNTFRDSRIVHKVVHRIRHNGFPLVLTICQSQLLRSSSWLPLKSNMNLLISLMPFTRRNPTCCSYLMYSRS